MLDLRRLRLLRELHARGTIAAVADALQFTPSAVSQQLAVLEREAGVPLLERAGRGVRLTDAALVLVGHADALLERAELAEAELAAAAGDVAGPRADRGASSRSPCASPSRRCEALAREAPAPALRARRGRARAVAARRSRSATSTSCSATSGSTSRTRARAASSATTCCRDPRPRRPARAATRRRGATPARCRWPSSPARRGPPATRARAGRR